MKRLFVIRHAKSSHDDIASDDFDRPLNQRGRSDAHLMASKLRETIDRLDYVLVSSSKRTRETVAEFIEVFDLEDSRVLYTKALYLPSENEIWREVRKTEDKHDYIAVVTHNPAAEYLLQRYRPGTPLPTCSIIELQYPGDKWSGIGPHNVRFVSLKYPKLYV